MFDDGRSGAPGRGDGPSGDGDPVGEGSGFGMFAPTETDVPVAGPLARARAALTAAADEAAALPRATGGQLSDGLGQAWAARLAADQLTLTLALEATRRGLHLQEGMSLHDWLAGSLPWASSREVADLTAVAKHADDPGNAPVRDAATGGRLPLRRAATLVRTLERVRPALPRASDPDRPEEGSYDHAAALLLGVAADPHYSDRDLTTVADHLLEVALPEHTRKSREKAQRQMRGVNESSLADGSLTRFVITAEAEGAATIRAVLTSPLAAPAPDADGPDSRTAAQRRYDALLTVLRRGVAGGHGQPTTPKAQVSVQIRWQTLTGELPGTGTTLLGDTLAPETVRRMACDADLIPQVLGTEGEVLDQGRRRRLATPGQRTALATRDTGCTYPGVRREVLVDRAEVRDLRRRACRSRTVKLRAA